MNDITDIIRSSLMLFPDMTPKFAITIFIEVAIISYLVYEILLWVQSSRAWILVKGIIFIVIFTVIAEILNLDIILWIIKNGAYGAVMALLIIFQPELRKGLESLGSNNILSKIVPSKDSNKIWQQYKEVFTEIAKASFSMGSKCTGALMVIKKTQSLDDVKKTGITINGLVTAELLINIFEKNTPLHDGAVVIEGDQIASATCYLPLTDSINISKELGTRHRAAIGISEVNDCIVVVVSEETGRVTVAENGKIYRMESEDKLVEYLMNGSSEFTAIKGKVKVRRNGINT